MNQEHEKIWKVIPSDKRFLNLFTDVSQKILEVYTSINQDTVYKSDNSPQTRADRISDELITKFLKANSPFPILSEESEADTETDQSEFFWIVDPLDGTKDFLKKTGEFSIMVGLVRNQMPIFGAVYHPISGQCCFARKENGAFLMESNGSTSRLQVSDVMDVASMRMTLSRSFTKGTDIEVAKRLGIQDSNLILHGSFGLKSRLVAMGEAEIFLNSSGKTSIWDSAPNIVIVSEAGGQITDLNGQELLVDPNNRRNENGIVVTNGRNHVEITNRIRELVNQIRQ